MEDGMEQDDASILPSTVSQSSCPPPIPSSNLSLSLPPFDPLSQTPPQPLPQTSSQLFSQSSTVTPSPFKVPRKNAKYEDVPRIRAYPEGSSGPWVVFFRPKGKPLNVLQISRDLTKRFSAVSDITKVRPNRLRVSVTSLKQANEIAACELFTREYHVYVPSREVEIDGVVSEGSLTCEDLLQFGIGRFKDSQLQPVKILECKQLYSVSVAGDKKTYSRSDSFRVTFAGSALPSHVVIDKVRLPVRLFISRVMNCLNCKQLGHTATNYCNKARCSKCGENHTDDSCIKGTERAFTEGRLRMSSRHAPCINSAGIK